jgi:glycosyltransferase involved in cell wall biosynthesis
MMHSTSSRVSVIVPVYNSECYITEAIQSIERQQYQALEVIVIDDHSTDRTAEKLEQFRHLDNLIYYRLDSNIGPSAARNQGIRIASGDFIAFLDADDIWPEGTVINLIDYLNRHPSADIIQGHIQDLWLSDISDYRLIFSHFGEPRLSFNLGSAIFNRELFDRVGLFDEQMRRSEDVDLWVRIREKGVSKAITERVTLFYRRHPYCSLRKEPQQLPGFAKVLKKNLDQRRLNQSKP